MITHVAVKYEGCVWALPAPGRHHDVLRTMFEHDISSCEPSIQGFLDSSGNFHDRLGAMKVASDAGQLKRRTGVGNYQGPELFSEDIW